MSWIASPRALSPKTGPRRCDALDGFPIALGDLSAGDLHVGSLLGPLSRLRSTCGFATHSFAADHYAAADHPAWRKQMHQAVMDCLFYQPAKIDFAAQCVEKVDCGKYVREKIYFNTTPAFRVPAFVLTPKGINGRAPAIVALHDHGGFYNWGKEKLVDIPGQHAALAAFKKRFYSGRSIASDLAEQGYIVIVIDAFYFGERRLRLPGGGDPNQMTPEQVSHADQISGQTEPKICRRIYNGGATWTGLQIWDDLCSVDYLLSRPDVDPQRLGCVGLSLGAFRAAHLIALDPRVKAAVACGWMTSFANPSCDNMCITIEFGPVIPGIYGKLDFPDVISLAAPRALLCINGTKDPLFPLEEGVKPAYRILEKVYAKLSAPDKFRGQLFDTGHEFNQEMQHQAWDWFAKFI